MSPVERLQLLLVEDLGDEAEVAQGRDVAALAGRDPGRLLAAVLERVEAEVGEPRDVVSGRVDAEHAALVARAVAVVEEPLGQVRRRALPRSASTDRRRRSACRRRLAARRRPVASLRSVERTRPIHRAAAERAPGCRRRRPTRDRDRRLAGGDLDRLAAGRRRSGRRPGARQLLDRGASPASTNPPGPSPNSAASASTPARRSAASRSTSAADAAARSRTRRARRRGRPR